MHYAVIPVFVNEFDDGFHQVILNEVKNLIILAHEILLPPRRDQAPPVGLRPDSVRRTTSRGGMTDLMNTDSVTDIID